MFVRIIERSLHLPTFMGPVIVNTDRVGTIRPVVGAALSPDTLYIVSVTGEHPVVVDQENLQALLNNVPYSDIVFFDSKDDQWYFWDEGGHPRGPYHSEEAARAEAKVYADGLVPPPPPPPPAVSVPKDPFVEPPLKGQVGSQADTRTSTSDLPDDDIPF